jgi:GNAT superfamily N-acetyltransferase
VTPVDICPVTAADRDALARFTCREWARPWTAAVEATVHCLADELAHSRALQARGAWVGDELVAVVAWQLLPGTSLCQSVMLAVHIAHRRRGYGRTLKNALLGEARRAGCAVVASKVHWDNTPMLQLNKALGANVERSDDPGYAYCVIPLATSTA